MRVLQGMMVVRMVVRFTRRIFRYMLMLVMLIVGVTVRVIENIMGVVMDMPLGKMQPCTQSHEQPGDREDRRQWHAEDRRRRQCPNEWSCSVVSARARGAEMA